MPGTFRSSLIISTYNNPAALELVLLSLAGQTVMPLEAIIADDGSKADTRKLIQAYSTKSAIPIHHVWHEDDGFRAAAIRNKALAKCSGEFIIQIDGDIIMHPKFIQDHIANAKNEYFNVGSRVLLDAKKTTELQSQKKWKINFLSKGVKNHINALRLPFLTSIFYKPKNDAKAIIEEIRGCNMSYWLSDMKRINGYNEDFIGWGREDSELGVRLVLAGITKRQLKFAAVQYHQDHPINSRDRYEENNALLNNIVEKAEFWCKNGLDKHLK